MKEIEDILIKIFVFFNKTLIAYLTSSMTSNKHNCQINLLTISWFRVFWLLFQAAALKAA